MTCFATIFQIECNRAVICFVSFENNLIFPPFAPCSLCCNDNQMATHRLSVTQETGLGSAHEKCLVRTSTVDP